MGEVRDREDFGHFDAGGQAYNRDRVQDRARFETTHTAGQQGYSSGSYGPSYFGNRDAGGFRSFTGNDFGGADFAGPQSQYVAGRNPAAASGAYGSGSYGEGRYRAAPRREYGDYRNGSERGFFERAGDEVASWFGDDDAARRREQDHRGRGPATDCSQHNR